MPSLDINGFRLPPGAFAGGAQTAAIAALLFGIIVSALILVVT